MNALYIKAFRGKWWIMCDQEETSLPKTVNLLAYAYAGSNPALPTTFILSELKTKAPPQRRGFFFECAQNVLTFSAPPRPAVKSSDRLPFEGCYTGRVWPLQFPPHPRYKDLSDRGLSLAVSFTHHATANPLFALHQPGRHLRSVS